MKHDIKFHNDIPEHIKKFCDEEFQKISMKAIGDARHYFTFEMKDGKKTIGAAHGYNYGPDLIIQQVILTEDNRGKGMGTHFMEKIENLARERGCTKIWVDTMDYQAPEFYVRLGYEEAVEIKNYRRNHSRIFFKKHLG